MKLNNKGKVHPSPSPNPSGDYLSVLKLLPPAILVLASALSLDDQEVIAYMIAKDSKKKSFSKKTPSSLHKSPVFGCDCFDCYTSYWFRWDSSPNRKLIDQLVEAFEEEEHLTSSEAHKSKKNARPRRRPNNKTGSRALDNSPPVEPEPSPSLSGTPVAEEPTVLAAGVMPPEKESAEAEDSVEGEASRLLAVELKAMEDQLGKPTVTTSNKGLARMVLPDVMGLFNSRLWNLWSPKV